MTTLTMKIKKAIKTQNETDKVGTHIHVSMAELKTLVNMQRVIRINCRAISEPQTDITTDRYYSMPNTLQINRKQANEIVDDRLDFQRIKKETHHERIYISEWNHGKGSKLYIVI